ncbi:TetR/AcrR family transcriptional regulator [Enterococcus sp. DIV0756]|uniref:TetR/AcrR family transcriptional regulator n=1 Tax=Enterococcus sp. DIV0756 TaxID=2774636 RepID=UPI003F251FF4
MVDRRTAKTKRAIKNAFLDILKVKSINKITISELSEKADIGRGTFYLHYHDLYDVYESVERDLYAELVEMFDEFSPYVTSENLLALTNEVTAYIDKKRELFLLLMDVHENILNKIKEIFNEKVLQDECYSEISEYEQLEALFIVAGTFGILEEWLRSGLDMPLEQVSKILHQLLMKFNLQ